MIKQEVPTPLCRGHMQIRLSIPGILVRNFQAQIVQRAYFCIANPLNTLPFQQPLRLAKQVVFKLYEMDQQLMCKTAQESPPQNKQILF